MLMISSVGICVRAVVGLLLLLALLGPRPACAAGAADTERAVIVISVDGLAAFYFDDPQAEMPTTRSPRPARRPA
jgi:hypothetical protein